MKRFSKLLTGVAMSVLLGLMSLSTQAAVDFNPRSFSLDSLNDTDTVIFPYFDTMGGTRVLNSVSVSYFFVQAVYSTAIENDSSSPNEVEVSVVGDVAATNLPGFTSFDVAYSASDTQTIAGNDSAFYTLVDIVDNFASPNPADFIGTGNFTVTLTGTGLVSTASLNDPALPFSIDVAGSSVSGDLNVDYTYTAIPEPASLMLLGMGSLSLMRRRR